MSAASFLGIAGLVSLKGYDGLIYSVGWLVGWPIIMFLVAEPLRNLGKYTFADVLAYRLSQKPIRIAASIGALTTVAFYLIAQMVGAGNLVKLMFRLPFEGAVIAVGAVMIAYVLFGGMLATTWVQIIKAGLPHILMRFYTVPDAKEARKSVFYATGFIGYFYILTFIIGFGSMVLVGQDLITKIDKGGNMAAPLLAEATGGTMFLGFIAAVAFATILAVVAGLTLAGASTLSHDLYVNVVRSGHSSEAEEVRVAKIATLLLGILAIVLGIAFKGQNVAFMVGLAFAVAASANFPALLMSIMWKGFTTSGAVASIIIGTVLAVGLIVISPTVWIDVLKNPTAIFPLKNPAIISMTAAFIVGIVFSLAARDSRAASMYEEEKLRTYLGVGAE